MGRQYVYSSKELERFFDEWAGYDLGSEGKVLLALQTKKALARNADR